MLSAGADLESASSAIIIGQEFFTSALAGYSFLVFNLLCAPCFAAIGAMNAEITDRKWFYGGIALQLSTGYTVGFAVYQIGTLVTTGKLGAGFGGGLAVVAVIAAVLTWLCVRAGRTSKTADTQKSGAAAARK